MLLVLSLWPGYAGGCWVLLALPLIALLGLAWLAAAVKARRLPAFPLRQVLVAPLVVCLTYGLLKFYVPRRVVFFACQSQFEPYLASAPVSEYQGKPLGRWLGVYRVDEYAADPRGGVYFRTGTGRDGIGPDRMSYGFAHRPNRQGSPYGAARYGTWRQSDDWY